MIRTLLTLALALPLFFATASTPLLASTTHHTAAHGPTPSDAQIDSTIRTKLAKSKIGKEGFHYKVQHGVVTWDGNTDVAQHKGSATRMARTAGAAQVVNNIQVSAKGKAKATASLKKASIKTT